MSIQDYDDELTTAGGQSYVGNFGTAIVGTKVKDAGGNRDWGAGETLHPYLRNVAAIAGGSGGVQVDIVAADNAALTTNPVVLATRTITQAELTANSIHHLPALRPGFKKRYCGVKLTPLTSNTTQGTAVVGFTSKDGRPQDGVNAL